MVRDLALKLPEVVETASYGTPSFKIRKRMIARLREEGDVLVVRIDLDDKEYLIQTRPDIYFTMPHYDGYPAVLIRLTAIRREELAELLTAAWRFVAPSRLVAAFEPRST
ncbi:MAG: MmcQ/YjbR family DNA-binding protein [Candidatus Dormibacteraeota bacterium]|uniref:MmcQ/YjbR family DNA-binding protein n=2 Tax=Candidatus Dormiibacter inghamiae TaxID=3127013 RepID=A0A934KA93_9BACT|nr:MmcQ/YjbR family DNA-binding protein [Candidatus Dormibacteraeota bacterium]MBJ7606779.1 MmcQ/YjbR family DNA-binding protein [Candidatus Dormibacteraeota bacterium]